MLRCLVAVPTIPSGNTDSSMVLLAGAKTPHQFVGVVVDVARYGNRSRLTTATDV
jgi:hypothetical protein